MRNTMQRRMILQTVRSMDTHPTAEEVYRQLHVAYPTMSKATVYRNLHRLAKEGEIQPVLLPGSPERFDRRLSPHCHFTCRKCNRIVDVDMDFPREMDALVQKSVHGAQVEEQTVTFRGICPSCLQRGGTKM